MQISNTQQAVSPVTHKFASTTNHSKKQINAQLLRIEDQLSQKYELLNEKGAVQATIYNNEIGKTKLSTGFADQHYSLDTQRIELKEQITELEKQRDEWKMKLLKLKLEEAKTAKQSKSVSELESQISTLISEMNTTVYF